MGDEDMSDGKSTHASRRADTLGCHWPAKSASVAHPRSLLRHWQTALASATPRCAQRAPVAGPWSPAPGASRSAFTLMELMVVIVIVVILTSSMIPIMSSASDARRCREGARLVSTMLSAAQTRAVANGRSAGVLFQPMKNNPYACMEMYLVEVPPPYTGDTYGYLAQINVTTSGTTITATVTINDGTATGTPTFAGMPMTTDPTTTQRLLRPGDLIQFNYPRDSSPAYYVLNAVDSNPYITSNSMSPNTMTLSPSPIGQAPWPPPTTTGGGVPFRIVRQPLKTSDPPAQLADGAAVDWYFSGVDLAPPQGPPSGATSTNYPEMSNIFGARGTATTGGGALGPAAMANTCGPVIVTFNATGNLEQVYYSCCYPASTSGTAPYFYQGRPLSGAYFLVGKIEKISQLPTGPIQNDASNPPNYQDGDARWVAITRQSGLVTTTEVAKLQPSAVIPPGSTAMFPPAGVSPQTPQEWAGVLNAVMNSRRYASGNQNSGGI